MDHWCEPDIIVCAKGLGSGYTPLYCVITEEKIHSSIKSGTGNFIHGFTYGQNPQSCAIGLAVLNYIEKNNLISKSVPLGSYLNDKLKSLLHHPVVGDVRGLGLFAGVELVKDKKSKEPFASELKVSALIANRAFEMGLITYPGNGGADGIRGDHILIAPPFIITEDQIDFMVSTLDAAIGEITKEHNLA
jgi:adenosylmethionine-8-amino-7-oxononanoate aminotransferase